MCFVVVQVMASDFSSTQVLMREVEGGMMWLAVMIALLVLIVSG